MADETQRQVAVPPKRGDFVPLNKVGNLKELFQHPEFASRIAGAAPKHFNAERLLRTMVQATNKTPKLNEVTPMSMLGACITIAALGLEPNTPLQYAHLIPFEVNKWNPKTREREYIRTDVQVIIGYQGYLELIYRNDKIKSVECDVFYEDDIKSGRFKYSRGSRRELVHNIDPSIVRDPATPIAGAYMFVELQNGGTVFEVMSLADLHRSRARSQGYQAAMFAYEQAVKSNKDPQKDKRYADAPWIKDFIQMCKKTVLRIGQKWVPKTIELASALTIDGEAEDVTIDFSTVSSADNVFDGTYETVETEQTQIAEDKTPKVTVPIEKEKIPVSETAKAYGEPKPPRSQTQAKPKPQPTNSHEPEMPSYMQDDQPYRGAPEDAPGWTASEGSEAAYPMFNYLGEGDDGPFGPAIDPVTFAREYSRVYAEATPDQRITLAEFNEETMTAVFSASPQAQSIILAVHEQFAQKVEAKPAMTMEPKPNPPFNDTAAEELYDIPRTKTPKGGWDVVEWTRLAKIVIAGLGSRDAIMAMCAVNRASIYALPKTAATIFQNYVDDRLRILEPTQPEDDEIPNYDDEVPLPPDPIEKLFVQFETMISTATSLDNLHLDMGNAAVKVQLRNLQAARPDLAEKLTKRYVDRENELRGN